MPATPKNRYTIKALQVPDDWNPPGTYQTISVNLPDAPHPIEWRAHESTAPISENTVAGIIVNYLPYRDRYEAAHGPRPDLWASYDIPAHPAHKLIVHQALADRIPTAYLLPAHGPHAYQLPDNIEPITQRA